MANKDKKNIDQAEVEKFNLLAHKWWDPTSEFKPLHEINPLRVNFIKSKVDLSGKELLDVGCGGGILSESMAKEGAHVTAIDQGENVIKIAQLHTIESKLDINYKQLNIEDLLKSLDLEYKISNNLCVFFDIIQIYFFLVFPFFTFYNILSSLRIYIFFLCNLLNIFLRIIYINQTTNARNLQTYKVWPCKNIRRVKDSETHHQSHQHTSC